MRTRLYAHSQSHPNHTHHLDYQFLSMLCFLNMYYGDILGSLISLLDMHPSAKHWYIYLFPSIGITLPNTHTQSWWWIVADVSTSPHTFDNILIKQLWANIYFNWQASSLPIASLQSWLWCSFCYWKLVPSSAKIIL